MKFEIIKSKFLEYVKKFDLKDQNIMRKFHHSFRVMEYSKEIARSLNLSDEDIELAIIIGLVHDIGRFEQWTKFNTYDDTVSLDHGDLASEILNYLLENSSDKQIILKAVKNHNKVGIENGLDDRTMLFCKIIKDADKLDIMKEQGLVITVEDDYLEENVMDCFFKGYLITNETEHEKTDFNAVLRYLAFIYDINFKYSFEFIKQNNIVENKINLLKSYSTEDEKLDKIKDKLLSYIDEKLA